MADPTEDKLVEPRAKQSIEEIVEEAEVLKSQAEIEDDEAEQKAEEEAKIPEVEVDLDAERERTKQETTEAILKDVVEPLKKEIGDLKQSLSPAEKDEYDTFVDDYTAKNGKAPEWKEVAIFLKDQALQELKNEQKAEADAKVKADAEAKEATEKQNAENFKVWQGQLDDMETRGLLPKMEKAEVGDPGFDARVKLYGFMQTTWNTPNPSTNLYEVHTKYWKDEPRQPAGADAPVSMGESGGVSDDPDDYKYSDIHNGGRDLETFIAKELARAAK
jgi:hypothetical protein